VIPEHLVGYRQSGGSLSRDITPMAQSIDLVSRWIFEKWPDLPESLQRERVYYTGLCLAQRALDNNQFVTALRYRVQASRACPETQSAKSNLAFYGRLLFRMTGFRRATLRKHGLTSRVSFTEFQRERQVQADDENRSISQ
jgi:hypothetical protein